MGLDNGIVVRKIKFKEWPQQIGSVWRYDDNCEVEICYWRKCWGIRSEMFRNGLAQDEGDCELHCEDIPTVIHILHKYLDEDYYNAHHDSIWSFEDMKQTLQKQIKNLTLLYGYAKDHPQVQIEFYDSY